MNYLYISRKAKKDFTDWIKQWFEYLEKLNIKDRIIELETKNKYDKLKKH